MGEIIKRNVIKSVEVDTDLLKYLLEEKKWPEAKLDELLAAGWNPEDIINIDDWSKRYMLEGEIWGYEPSRTARVVADNLGPASRLLEIGFGYGRDLRYLLEHEHTIHGIEEATEGLTMATAKLKTYKQNGKMTLIDGDVKNVALHQKFFDAVYAHRMLHLIKPKSVGPFVNRVAGALREGGLLVLTARNHKDFNEDQMERIDEDTAKYKKRDNHYVNFWNEERFRREFGRAFNHFSFQNFTEQESVGNSDVETNLTMMIARKLTKEEIAERDRQHIIQPS